MLLVRTVLLPSPIDGIGVFADQPIARGDPVWRFVPGFDVVIPPGRAAELGNAGFLERYTQQCPLTRWLVLDSDDARFMNHADDPNVDTLQPLHDPSLVHRALRDIAAGEELTCDYRVGDANPWAGFIRAVAAK